MGRPATRCRWLPADEEMAYNAACGAAASPATINGLVQAAVSATGIQSNTLFGVERDIDMSQC
jgi:hypothetical protein